MKRCEKNGKNQNKRSIKDLLKCKVISDFNVFLNRREINNSPKQSIYLVNLCTSRRFLKILKEQLRKNCIRIKMVLIVVSEDRYSQANYFYDTQNYNNMKKI